MVVLDLTIANVSIQHIAGNLAIDTSQGTWIITSYSVAEAVCVPLTGWLSARFGTVRTYIYAMAGFGICSFLCGTSTTLTMLVLARIGQGICGGPIMPLSQTLLRQIFKPEQQGKAMGLWAMTTIIAPIMGPILGGWLSDDFSWHWAFFINVPVAILCVIAARRILTPAENKTTKAPIDVIGFLLLLLGVGSLQIMLDLGRDYDWFNSWIIVALSITALTSLTAFVINELGEKHPIVDLRVFRHRGFTLTVLAVSIVYGLYLSSLVILPQWLQISLGYTATKAGIVMSFNGVAAVMVAGFVARMSNTIDGRLLMFVGVVWMALMSFMRVGFTSSTDYYTLAMPQLLQGFGIPFFFIASNILALGAVEPQETASAAGLMNFTRTIFSAIATAITASYWDNLITDAHSNLSNVVNGNTALDVLRNFGTSLERGGRETLNFLVSNEAIAVGTTKIFFYTSVILLFSAVLILMVPKPRKVSQEDMKDAH